MTEQRKRIVEEIFKAFPKTQPPDVRTLVEVQCPDAQLIKENFGNQTWWQVSETVIAENFARLPFFSITAYQYYLPAYVLYALKSWNPFDNVVEYLIYDLEPFTVERDERRRAAFTDQQRQIIVDFLSAVTDDKNFKRYHQSASATALFWNAPTMQKATS